MSQARVRMLQWLQHVCRGNRLNQLKALQESTTLPDIEFTHVRSCRPFGEKTSFALYPQIESRPLLALVPVRSCSTLALKRRGGEKFFENLGEHEWKTTRKVA